MHGRITSVLPSMYSLYQNAYIFLKFYITYVTFPPNRPMIHQLYAAKLREYYYLASAVIVKEKNESKEISILREAPIRHSCHNDRGKETKDGRSRENGP